MSWTAEVKAQFTVFVLQSNVEKGAAMKASLVQEGFDVYLMTDPDGVVERMKANPCHLLVFSPGSLYVPLEDFVRGILLLSPEVQFVPYVAREDMNAVLPYRKFNFSPPVIEGEGGLTLLAWTVDQVCHSLFFLYQNEQLFDVRQKLEHDQQTLQAQLLNEQAQLERERGIALADEAEKYAGISSKEEVLNIFLREMNHGFLARNQKVAAIYFKYLPTVQSFVAMQSLGIDVESIKGVGGKLSEQESQDPERFFAAGNIPKAIQNLLVEGLGVADSVAKPILVRGVLDGILAVWGVGGKINAAHFANELALFQLMFERGHLIRQLNSADLADTVTELHGRQFYLRHLSDEVSRARRLQKAVSIIKLSIDHFVELEQSLGRGGRDQILRLVASMVQKSSRVNDLVCRTADNEFSLILPHTARKGASLRAERLRRMLEVNSAKLANTPITISCGVAEYPTHASSYEDLDKVGLQALEYVSNKGGNRVCLFQPPEGFVPDYEVAAL